MYKIFAATVLSLQLTSAFANENPMNFAKNPNWKTKDVEITTEYGVLKVQIHSSLNQLSRVARVEEIIRQDLIKVINYFKYVPRDVVHFNIDPYLKLANGNATTFPQNIINLYTHPSVEKEHLVVMEDWMRGLILHEYVHVTHLDQTRDYLESGRKIFGTIPKVVPAITPRWFTEGIATWAESQFLPGGRLQNRLLQREYLIKMNDPYFCQTLDCMDNAGVHPYGQMSYWFGSGFLNYIEEKQPETIKCLVETNSMKLPFSLSSVFEKCTGKDVYGHFADYKEFLKSEFGKLESTVGKDYFLANVYGADDPQKGFILLGDTLLKVEDNRRHQALTRYDLKDGLSSFKTFSHPITTLSDSTTFTNEDGELEHFVLVGFNEDPFYRKENRKFRWVNADTLVEEEKINFRHDPLMVKALNREHFITASYEDGQFTLREILKGDLQKVMVLPLEMNLTSLEWGEAKKMLWVKGAYQNKSFIGHLNLKTFELKKVFSTEDFLQTENVDGNLVVSTGKKGNLETFYLKFDHQNNQVTKTLLKEHWLETSPATITNENWRVCYSKAISFQNEDPEKRRAIIKNNALGAESVLTSENINEEPIKNTTTPDTFRDYFSLETLRPKWWFLSLASESNLSTFGLQTGFSDSVNRHSGDIILQTYSSEKDTYYGGLLSYNFRQDQWLTNIFLKRLVSENESTKAVIDEQELNFSSMLRVLNRRYTFMPGFEASYEDQDSDVTVAKTWRTSLRFRTQYQAMSLNDLFQSFNLNARWGLRFPESGNSFKDWQLFTDGKLQFWPELQVTGKIHYGRLEKSNFKNGVLYGAGYSTSTSTRNFEFYGLPYGAVYGNEIIAARLRFDYRVFEFYRGYQLWPFFARDLNLLFGRDWISGDRVIVGRQVLKDKAVNSAWIGANLKWTFAYNVPVETKFVLAKVFNPDGGDVREAILTFDAELF